MGASNREELGKHKTAQSPRVGGTRSCWEPAKSRPLAPPPTRIPATRTGVYSDERTVDRSDAKSALPKIPAARRMRCQDLPPVQKVRRQAFPPREKRLFKLFRCAKSALQFFRRTKSALPSFPAARKVRCKSALPSSPAARKVQCHAQPGAGGARREEPAPAVKTSFAGNK